MRSHSFLFYFAPFFFLFIGLSCAAQDSVLQFVFTSDVHYGITRKHFRGAETVPSDVVNRAMIAAINQLPGDNLPQDSGMDAGEKIGHLDGILITGDIANREEKGVQPAAVSWQQYQADYDHLITTKDRKQSPTPILLGPGNHDVSNAIGYWKPTNPGTDASSMAGIYNSMMSPAHARTAANYNYTTDKIHFIRDIGGIKLLFVNCWPDSMEQAWMDGQLRSLKPGSTVFLFTHSMPDVEARFFTNPNGNHSVDSADKFENLLPETFKDGHSVKDEALVEQRGLADFLQHHPEIKAYFHGHENYTEFYNWKGPDQNLSLPCFRVDSPMKGKFSSKDETFLAFELITIDLRKKTMTVRECLWNSVPVDPSVIKWGQKKTMVL